jgi:hypothetical protein
MEDNQLRITEADNDTTVVVIHINQFYKGENSFLRNNQFLETKKDGADEMQKMDTREY